MSLRITHKSPRLFAAACSKHTVGTSAFSFGGQPLQRLSLLNYHPKHCAHSLRSKHPTASAPFRNQHHQHLRYSSVNLTALVLGLIIAGGSLVFWDSLFTPSKTQSSETDDQPQTDFPSLGPSGPTDPLAMPISPEVSTEIPPGRPGNLTKDQEKKLKELWYEIGKLCGYYDGPRPSSLESERGSEAKDSANSVTSKQDKKKSRFFGRKSKDTDSVTSADENQDNLADKHGSNKEFRTALAAMSHDELKVALWDFCKSDDPDACLCRYLRARKWNVHNSLVMLISTIYWRDRIMKLDQDVMKYGEEEAKLAMEGRGNSPIDGKLGGDMIKQLRMGKSFVHGCDKLGRPIVYVRVRLHKGGEYSAESLERLTVYMIETTRVMLRPPTIDTGVIIFDMTGFSLANMDYTPVKFMIKVFEANYPESLGAVLVHKAPWVFSSIWSVIKGWLDPVVASKISFTKTMDDLEEYIPAQNIPKELGGEEDWEWEYVEPIEGENSHMANTSVLEEAQKRRSKIIDEFQDATQEWVLGQGDEKAIQEKREKLSKQMQSSYWDIDPFFRSKSVYDRIGMIGNRGEIDFYPSPDKTKARMAQLAQPNGAVESKPALQNGTATAAGAGAAALKSPAYAKEDDARSINSVASVYYDAQSELD